MTSFSLMSAMRVAAAPIVAIAMSVACAGARPTVGTTPNELPPSNLARLDSAMPTRVGDFRLVDRRRMTGLSDMSYRFRDGSSAIVSVYLYLVDRSNGPERSARERVEHEGKIFLEVLPIQVSRGVYDSFEPLVSRTDSLVVHGAVIPGYFTSVRVRRRTAAAHELQFLHIVGGDFVKLRATVPETWPIATLQALDSAIVTRLVQP